MPPIRMRDISDGADLASQACSTCRRQRRKCTKEMPTCLLCRRLGKPCEYANDLPTRSDQDEVVFLRSQVAALEDQLAKADPNHDTQSDSAAPNPFPAVFFLDSHMFQASNQAVLTPVIDVPTHLVESFNLESRAPDIATAYFSGFHSCFPVISKKRMLQRVQDPFRKFQTDLKLLVACMQLLNQGDLRLYKSCKALYAYIEAQNLFTLYTFQSSLLLAIYEVGHAIYPQAYLSVGNCARLGIAMGLHGDKSCVQMLRRSVTATEFEERRRAWWAVIVLEMYINLGSRHHPLACPAPQADYILPQDDDKWDKGEMGLSQPLALSANATICTSPFARLCQVSHILSRVIRHVDDRSIDLSFRYEEAVQLRKTAESLSEAIADELGVEPVLYSDTPLLAALAVAYSTQMTLHERYACTGFEGTASEGVGSPELLELQEVALTRLKELSDAVLELGECIRNCVDVYGASFISPLVMDALYQAGANFAWMVAEGGGGKYSASLATTMEIFEVVGKRWRAADGYLEMIKASPTHS